MTPWNVVHGAPLSMEFCRQEYWSRLPFPSPGDLPNPGIEAGSPALQADSLPSKLSGKSGVIPFTYCMFAICFGIWTYDAWRFCSFLRLLWIFCIFGDSIWSLRLFVFYYCKKKKKSPLGFNGDIIEFVDVFRYCEHVNNTVFQSMNTRCLSIYLYLLLFLWFIFCSFKCISIGKDVEKLEDLCTVGKNVKYCSSYEKIP